MAQEGYRILESLPGEKIILNKASLQNQDALLNSELTSELYNVLCFDKHENDSTENDTFGAVEIDGRCSGNSFHNYGVENSALSGIQDLNFLPESVRSISEAVSPVTHIEIIKSGSRRVTGANRVVPLLTSALKTGKLAFADSKLAEVYKTFLSDLGNNESNKSCMICHKVLLSYTELEHHVKNIHCLDVSADQCFVCRKKFIFKDQLRIHLSQTHNINCPDLICKICFMEFSTTIEQKAHERKHDEFHSCQMCNKKFSSAYLHQKHLNQHTFQVKPNECKKCGRRFKNDVALNIHKKRHTNVICTGCNMHFPSDIDLLLHIKEHKTDDIMKLLKNVEQGDQEESQLEEMLTLYAKLASKTTTNALEKLENNTQENSIQECINTMVSTVSQLNDNDISNKKGAECRLCGMNVSSEKELLDHRKQFHLRNRTCPFCGKRNRSVSQTWRHMQSHLLKNKRNVSKLPIENKDFKSCSAGSKVSCTNTKQPRKKTLLYSCNICSRKFLYSGSRDNHVLQHSKDKCDSWKCTVCGQAFSHPGLLLTHASAHEPSLKCQICDKQFLSQTLLNLHIKSHFGEEVKKVFKCNVCSVECPSLAGLQAHRRCHTGERPYTCGECHRRFKRRQAVKKHIQVVHNSASLQYHSCSQCRKRFNSSGNLIRHYLRVHCQVRRFICGVCGSRFSQNQDLRRHFKVSHEIEMPNISGSDRKALQEIYVIPDINDLSETNPHALKIKAIVAEEKAKFSGLSELLMNKGINKEDICAESAVQSIQNFPNEGNKQSVGTLQHDTINEPKRFTCSEFTEKKMFSAENVDSKKLYRTNSRENYDGKLYLCEHCNKNFPGENEYMEHIAERSKSYVCKQCSSVFCDQVLLDKHLASDHVLQCSISINDVNREENYLKHVQGIDNIQVVHSMASISHELQNESCQADQGKAFIAPIEQQGLTVLPNITADTSNFIANNDIGSTVISKHALSLLNNGENNISTTLNINGIILQNIIIQQTPTVLQSVPLSFQNQQIVNPATSMTPFVTFNSPNVGPVDTHPSFLNVNDHSMALSGCANSVNSVSASEMVPESVNQEISTNVKNNAIAGRTNSGSEEQELQNISEDMRQKNLIDKSKACDRDRKGVESKEAKKVKCRYCEEEFYNTSSLNRHMKSHGESKHFECPVCGKHFSEKHNLKTHMMTHTGERPYKCEDCGKQLRYRTDVLDHKRMHLGEKPFACEECGRKFIRQRELNRHKMIHTGEKKHECPVCGKSFARLDQLRHAHLPTHSDHNSQPMHTCNICNKSFRLKSKLKQHETLHTGLKPYKCELCKKSFALDVYLKAHMQCHKKRHNYIQCPKCPRRFISEATLQVHERTFHARLKKGSKQVELMNEGTYSNEEDAFLYGENYNNESELAANVEILHDIDLSMLDSNNCNAVIFLQMPPEDVKLHLSVDN